jgi:hypothetical protein
MDPKSTAQPSILPADVDAPELQADLYIWEPPFERWQRLTEALIGRASLVSSESAVLRRPPRE